MAPAAISLPSIQSLYVTTSVGSNELTQGTAFMVHSGLRSWLVTNWHIVAGRHPNDGQPMHDSGATPDTLKVQHNEPTMGSWGLAEYNLLDDAGRPRWAEHPVYRRRVDVVALPMTEDSGLKFYPYPLQPTEHERSLSAGIAEDVSIIGFPFGIRGTAGVAIWSRGSVASEPEMDYNDLPCFLIDSRTRAGQSGSPVVVHSSGAGGHKTAGGLTVGLGPLTRLLGVYSGRINKDSDLGFVWKTSVVLDIVQRGVHGNGDLTPPSGEETLLST